MKRGGAQWPVLAHGHASRCPELLPASNETLPPPGLHFLVGLFSGVPFLASKFPRVGVGRDAHGTFPFRVLPGPNMRRACFSHLGHINQEQGFHGQTNCKYKRVNDSRIVEFCERRDEGARRRRLRVARSRQLQFRLSRPARPNPLLSRLEPLPGLLLLTAV